MRYAALTERLAGLGGAKWAIHSQARALAAAGRDIIELTIGEPDVPTPAPLIDIAARAMREGRTGYSDGRGEASLLDALAARYSAREGRAIARDRFLCFPGTQTTLYAVMQGIAGPGDEVLVGDPMYATYEGVIASCGAATVPVPLRANAGFRLQADDLAERVTTRSRVILLNTPHNPTGAILTRDDLRAICDLARKHDLWVLSDEVYEEMVFAGERFTSPLALAEHEDRVICAASISKSHAAPGFRSGWCVGPAEFTQRLLPLSETMLFGNQPFIADMTRAAISAPSPVAAGMATRFARRASLIASRLDGVSGMRVSRPQAGMFALLQVGGDDQRFARQLLETVGVAVMPGSSFGLALNGWLRLSLTQSDERILAACDRIADFMADQPA